MVSLNLMHYVQKISHYKVLNSANDEGAGEQAPQNLWVQQFFPCMPWNSCLVFSVITWHITYISDTLVSPQRQCFKSAWDSNLAAANGSVPTSVSIQENVDDSTACSKRRVVKRCTIIILIMNTHTYFTDVPGRGQAVVISKGKGEGECLLVSGLLFGAKGIRNANAFAGLMGVRS